LRSGIGDPTAKDKMLGKRSIEVNATRVHRMHCGAFSWRSA
jgi:hypothetical protein